MRRRAKIAAGVVIVVLGVAAFALFTETGRAFLPATLKKPAADTAQEIHRRAREATGPTFYTFTDDEGVVQIVDDIEKVPQKYRAKAKVSH